MPKRNQESPSPSTDRIGVRTASIQDIKAFTHPLRMRLWRLLSDHGHATASMLARQTGESSGQTSYHLRQLEKFGFVEEVAGMGTARERWWKPIGFSATLFPTEAQPVADPSLRALTRFLLDEHTDQMAQWIERAELEPEVWRDATTSTAAGTWMTVAELKRLSEALEAVIDTHIAMAWERHEHGDRSGERRVRAYVDTIVLPDVDP